MSKNDVAKIKQMLRQYADACTAGDSEAVLKTFANGVVFMPPDTPKLSGKKAIATWAQATLFDPFENKLQMKLSRAEMFGKQAFITGSFSLELIPNSGGTTLKGTGKHMARLKKERDGSWKYAQAIWNFDKPPA